MQRKSTLILLTSITLVIGLLAVGTVKVVGDAHRPSQSTVTTKKVVSKTKAKTTAKPTVMRTPINWRQSSETVAYPNVNRYPDL